MLIEPRGVQHGKDNNEIIPQDEEYAIGKTPRQYAANVRLLAKLKADERVREGT